MIDVIYVEREAWDYPRTREIVARFDGARVIDCERHGELFNRAAQNFRLQKQRPALMLAVKHGRKVLPVPSGYGLEDAPGYYFSHMLNCVYDCRYCFLQGMYRSANYVVFVNDQDFIDEIRRHAAMRDAPVWFFSGYDCDSLALEPVTGFVDGLLPTFADLENARLELRTKSTQTRALHRRDPLDNVVVAFSFTTVPAGEALEHKVPDIARRIDAMAALQARGWRVGVRFDPVIYHEGFEDAFASLCERIFAKIDGAALHSACIGAFRLPRDFFKRMRRLYPRERLFASHLSDADGMVGYPRELERALLDGARRRVSEYVAEDAIHCMDGGA